ncbi:hypothetical protein J3A83DRAFT_4088741 [Scleroderma citrinum]
MESETSDPNSLFDEPSIPAYPVALRTSPPIPGLFIPPVFLTRELEDEIAAQCMHLYFEDKEVNQIMLFGRTTSSVDGGADNIDARMGKGLPPFLISLLHHLSQILRPCIPDALHSLLFPSKNAPPRARQAILNLYHPGEGITPHVDLLNRFDDGIIGVSLGSGCSCDAGDADVRDRWDLYLPERSVLVLSKDARYLWTHGIPGRIHDLVQDEDGGDAYLMQRGTRLSITFRWLLPGADIVGAPDGSS